MQGWVCVPPLTSVCSRRSGVGAPVIGEIDGEYRHDSRRNILEWCLPVVDAKNKSGSLEFSIAGQPNDFFPVHVSFVSKKNYCNIQVSLLEEGGLRVGPLLWFSFPPPPPAAHCQPPMPSEKSLLDTCLALLQPRVLSSYQQWLFQGFGQPP